MVDGIARLLKGGSVVAGGLAGAFEITRSLPHGHVAAVLAAIRACGLAALIDRKGCAERPRVIAMVGQNSCVQEKGDTR